MAKTVTITLPINIAEPMLRQAAFEAAEYGAWCDYFTPRTFMLPEALTPKNRQVWLERFLASKRLVEAFGVEYQPTSAEETLTVYIPMKNQKRKVTVVDGMRFPEIVSEGEPDYKHPVPNYWSGVHADACQAAADRVVRQWKALRGIRR